MSLVLAAAAAPLIVGNWAYGPPLSDTRAPVEQCETDNGVRYTQDRRFAQFDGSTRGTWRMQGKHLIEQVTRRRADGAHELRVWPQPATSSLLWLSPNHLNLTDATGRVQGMIRCRGAE